MIHAGTIRTGSAHTTWVAGAYWINSQSWFLSTIFPGVIATVLPTTNGSVPTGAGATCNHAGCNEYVAITCQR